LDIATAALNSAKGVLNEHSESGAGPNSISDMAARFNPGDGMVVPMAQTKVMEG